MLPATNSVVVVCSLSKFVNLPVRAVMVLLIVALIALNIFVNKLVEVTLVPDADPNLILSTSKFVNFKFVPVADVKVSSEIVVEANDKFPSVVFPFITTLFKVVVPLTLRSVIVVVARVVIPRTSKSPSTKDEEATPIPTGSPFQ